VIAFSKFVVNAMPLDERYKHIDAFWQRWLRSPMFLAAYANRNSGVPELDTREWPRDAGIGQHFGITLGSSRRSSVTPPHSRYLTGRYSHVRPPPSPVLQPVTVGDLHLQNRIVMAPLTRSARTPASSSPRRRTSPRRHVATP
jgi:hypothetical protein